jgi:hypothetical protein
MDSNEIFSTFRSVLCRLYGYDENLKLVGPPKSPAKESKAFLQPRDFLNFAIQDSEALKSERNRVNCLGNSKRAIDAQVDHLIRRLGFLPLARKQRWSVPKKLDFIVQSGVIAPRILRNVNQLRNRLEHKFASPSKRQVEDALDIATLFISYGELVRVPSMNWGLSSRLCVRYDYDEMVFRFYEKNLSDVDEDQNRPRLSLAYGDEGFQEFYDFLMKTVPLMEKKGRLGEDIG